MPNDLTLILDRIASGNEDAIQQLVPLVYDQMRQIAASALRREANQGCDPTELVHEAYLRLVGNENLAWKSRSHFYGACAVVIRRILVDQARARQRLKRGGEFQQVALDQEQIVDSRSSVDLIALDDSLEELSRLSPRQAKLVELRFFGGLTEEEAAEILRVSRRTVSGDWVMAKAWLRARLETNET